jgi:hypothetical protein
MVEPCFFNDAGPFCYFISEAVAIGGKARGKTIFNAEKTYGEMENWADNLANAIAALVMAMQWV